MFRPRHTDRLLLEFKYLYPGLFQTGNLQRLSSLPDQHALWESLLPGRFPVRRAGCGNNLRKQQSHFLTSFARIKTKRGLAERCLPIYQPSQKIVLISETAELRKFESSQCGKNPLWHPKICLSLTQAEMQKTSDKIGGFCESISFMLSLWLPLLDSNQRPAD